MLITDGVGTSRSAAVTGEHELVVSTASAIHKATLRGDAYAWNAITSDIGTNDCALYVRNLSQDRLLVINRIYVWADVPSAIPIHLQTSSSTFDTGVAVVGVNLNTSSAKVADADGQSDSDTPTVGTLLLSLRNNETTGDEFGIDYMTNDEIILGTNGLIGVDIVADSAAYECTIIGYFIDA